MTTTPAVFLDRYGGPEVLRLGELPMPPMGPHDVRIRQSVVGLNYIDVNHRTGRYPSPQFPVVPGVEGAGVIEEVGGGVTEFTPGDRVVYLDVRPGAYVRDRVIPADRVVPLPSDISDEIAVAAMLKGMTAQILVRSVHPVRAGETVLVHAAAGGVGLMLCQWCNLLGARVIGTVGSAAKAALATAAGCHHTINYAVQDVVEAVRAIAGDRGIDVVYDGVGAATFEASLAVTRPRGMVVSFGVASGPVPPFDIQRLRLLGSLHLVCPSGMDYVRERHEYVARAGELFDLLRGGQLRASIGARYPFDRAQEAHAELEGRRTTGSSIFVLNDAAR